MEGSGAGSGFVLVTNGPDADPGSPKTYGSYGSGTLVRGIVCNDDLGGFLLGCSQEKYKVSFVILCV
jgi:hypothetical protein